MLTLSPKIRQIHCWQGGSRVGSLYICKIRGKKGTAVQFKKQTLLILITPHTFSNLKLPQEASTIFFVKDRKTDC